MERGIRLKGMKILHIASFKGNIGDVINHSGFCNLFQDVFRNASFDRIEMRDFYKSASRKNRRYFDKKLAEQINSYDLFILGGGGFFDLQWSYSRNGTTLDMPDEFISAIKVPVWVNAMGYHEYPGRTTCEMQEKFNVFLRNISSRNNWLLTVRNDASKVRIIKRYGSDFTNAVLEVPDNGFMFQPKPPFTLDGQSSFSKKHSTIGICVTDELFCNEYNKGITEEMFNDKMIDLVSLLTEEGNRVFFFPHTPSDINVISRVMQKIPSKGVRENISVAPYDAASAEAADILSAYYKACDCVIGMRFHSCILSLVSGKPTIALAGHGQIEALFSSLGLEEYCVRVDNENIDRQLYILIKKCLEKSKPYPNVLAQLKVGADVYHSRVLDFLGSSNG